MTKKYILISIFILFIFSCGTNEKSIDISEEISNLPEVKYYDEEIQSIKKDISPLSEELKEFLNKNGNNAT